MIESPRIEGLLRRIRREIRRRRAEYYGLRGAFWAAVAILGPVARRLQERRLDPSFEGACSLSRGILTCTLGVQVYVKYRG